MSDDDLDEHELAQKRWVETHGDVLASYPVVAHVEPGKRCAAGARRIAADSSPTFMAPASTA